MRINVDSRYPDCVYMLNQRSRFTTLLQVVFEDAMLKMNFLLCINAQRYSRATDTCALCALIVIFKFGITYTAIYAM